MKLHLLGAVGVAATHVGLGKIDIYGVTLRFVLGGVAVCSLQSSDAMTSVIEVVSRQPSAGRRHRLDLRISKIPKDRRRFFEKRSPVQLRYTSHFVNRSLALAALQLSLSTHKQRPKQHSNEHEARYLLAQLLKT